MTNLTVGRNERGAEIASWILTGVGLAFVLYFGLLPALLGGLLVYELVHILAGRLHVGNATQNTRKTIAVAVLGTLIVTALTLVIIGLVVFFRSDAGSLPNLVERLANILEGSRDSLPGWMAQQLPVDPKELQGTIVKWLREHAIELRGVGTQFGRAFVLVLIGMVVGALIALDAARPDGRHRPLADALILRGNRLGDSFRRVVFAQIRISALNTTLTAIYLAVLLPLFDVNLPLKKTMIAVTFVVGLMPVIGNLISNTVIVIISLSSSLSVAVASLGFLVIIHKLEYFVNARIVGSQIKAKAWEILLAMLAMEAAFGIAGVVAAPIYYAYLKRELADREMI
jgi:predicted PurR-regulated permease PerM